MTSEKRLRVARYRWESLRPAIVVAALGAALGSRGEGATARISPEALGRIDAHAHFFAEAKPVLARLERLNITAVNICVVDRYEPGYETADRVLYGTDLEVRPGQDSEAAARHLEAEYARDWAYFASAGPVDFDGRKVEGLDLPEPVLRALFRDNALRWVPGLKAGEEHRVEGRPRRP